MEGCCRGVEGDGVVMRWLWPVWVVVGALLLGTEEGRNGEGRLICFMAGLDEILPSFSTTQFSHHRHARTTWSGPNALEDLHAHEH